MGFGFPFALGSIMVSMCLSSQGHIASVYCFFFFVFFENGSDLNPHLNLQNSDPWPVTRLCREHHCVFSENVK